MCARRFTRAFRRPVAGRSEDVPLKPEFASLMDFMYSIQNHEVPILPIASQKALGILGRGLSGEIEQSRADVQTRLAFKQGIPSQDDRDSERAQDWSSIINEVSLLQHPPIRANPHFVDLLGVSFSVPRVTAAKQRAWPLFVTSRVNYGDLTSLILYEQSGLLTDATRMQLFAEVAEALFILHECGVAHGDIKPENFLIDQFEEGSGELNCMLTDFGSSTLRGQKRFPTVSRPWNAPEINQISDALGFVEHAQADIFAFGLIAIHILLPLNELENARLCLIRCPDHTDDQWRDTINEIDGVKQAHDQNALATKMLELVEKSVIRTEWRDLLQILIKATIQPVTGRRHIPWSELESFVQEYLSDSFLKDPREAVPLPRTMFSPATLHDSSHGIFNFAIGLEDLDDTDYVLRASIAEDLSYKATHSTCLSCRRSQAFQYAVCRHLGFGRSKERTSCDELLRYSGSSQADLLFMVRGIGSQYHFTDAIPESVRHALSIGILVSSERVQEYKVSGRLIAATEALNEEVETRVRNLGPDHIALARLRWELSLLLKAQGHLQEAEDSQQKVTDVLANHLGDRHTSTLIATTVLANIIADQGLHARALLLYKSIQPVLDERLGPDHPTTMTALQIMGLSFVAIGQYKDAETAFETVVLLRGKLLSPTHLLTIEAELCLATAFRLHGHYVKALDIIQQVENKINSYFIRDYFVKAQVYIAKACIYKDLNLQREASETILKALKSVENLELAEDDSLRLAALKAQASIHESKGELGKQEAILQQILQAETSVRGEDSTRWDVQTQLAESFLKQDQLTRAYHMASEVIKSHEYRPTEDTENLVRCTSVAALVLSRQGKQEEALKTLEQCRDSCTSKYGPNSYGTAQAITSLASCLAKQGEYKKARESCETTLPYYRDENNRGANGIAVLRFLAYACDRLGDFSNAEAYCQEAIVWATKAYGEDDKETIQIYDTLVRVWIQKGSIADAERLYRAKFEPQQAGSQLDIAFKRRLAELQVKEGNFDTATKLRHEVYRLMTSSLGRFHPDTVNKRGAIIEEALNISLTHQVETESLENIQDKKQVLGMDSPSTIKTMARLAYTYSRHGRLQEAENLFEEIDKICDVEHSCNLGLYAQILGKHANLLFQLNQFGEAETLNRKALKLRVSVYGDSTHIVHVDKVNLAASLHAQKKYVDAEHYLLEVVGFLDTHLSKMTAENIEEYLQYKGSLAAVLFAQGKLPGATEMFASIIDTAEDNRLDESTIAHWRMENKAVLDQM